DAGFGSCPRGQFRRLKPLRRLPQALQIVKLARLLGENVDDEVDIVDKDPLALSIALDLRGPDSSIFQAAFYFIGNGLYLPRVGAAAQDEIVGKCSGAFFHLQDGE